jgi:hypothetical protein
MALLALILAVSTSRCACISASSANLSFSAFSLAIEDASIAA